MDEEKKKKFIKGAKIAGGLGVGLVGAIGAVAAAPLVLPAMGFTSAGIAAGSFAASAMSFSATAGIGAGAVAAAQSAGAAGLAVSTSVLVGGAAGTAAGVVGANVAEKIAGAVVKDEKGTDDDSKNQKATQTGEGDNNDVDNDDDIAEAKKDNKVNEELVHVDKVKKKDINAKDVTEKDANQMKVLEETFKAMNVTKPSLKHDKAIDTQIFESMNDETELTNSQEIDNTYKM